MTAVTSEIVGFRPTDDLRKICRRVERAAFVERISWKKALELIWLGSRDRDRAAPQFVVSRSLPATQA